MYGVEKRFKMQLFLGLKGSPLVGATILNFVTPEHDRGELLLQPFFSGVTKCSFVPPTG